MSHPMEERMEMLADIRDRLWARRDAVEKRVNDLPLSAFKACQFPDLALLYDRRAVGERSHDLEQALARLEKSLDEQAALLLGKPSFPG